ncbi:MAG: hypothetical protein EBZ62_00055 [Sphingobacteriia bacterium]|nr:hypothetical protein [Sphingobacteriia bacterium]
MDNYKPKIKCYYGGDKGDSDHRVLPAPDMSISTNLEYNNDIIIGYTYTINLTGKITALDLRNTESNGDVDLDTQQYGIGAVIDHMHKMRTILSGNGGILRIVDENDNYILKARGGKLKSFNFTESDNNWVAFANYSASIEFNSLDFGDGNKDNCPNIFLSSDSYASNDYGIVHIPKFKIKSFSDSWSFIFDEKESYNRANKLDNNNDINIDNTSFTIQYNINAVGQHSYVYENDDNKEPKLLPAWEQAKNFVQERLYNQVISLIGGVLKDSYPGSCDTGETNNTLSTINSPGSYTNGLLSDIRSNYKIFNEKITCETSESDGSFSASYSALVKKIDCATTNIWTTPDAQHTVSKTVNKSYNGATTITTTINGSIQGLIEGGLIRSPKPIALPNTGSIFIQQNSADNKYNNAKILLDQIYNLMDQENNTGFGPMGKRDLKNNFKGALGITQYWPISFNLTHDYNNGIINYTVEYSNVQNICGRYYKELSIQVDEPTEIINVFHIPKSYPHSANKKCNTFIVQKLGTSKAKVVYVTIQGIDLREGGQPSTPNLSQIIQDGANCGNDLSAVGFPSDQNGFIATEKNFTFNPFDGSFNMSMTFVCATGDCYI